MAVKLTTGGLVSFAPGLSKKTYVKSITSSKSSSSSSVNRAARIAREKAAAEKAAREQAERIAFEKKLAEERIAAENAKRVELAAIREKLIQEQIASARSMGVLSSRQSAENVVLSRERAAIKQAGRTATLKIATVGEVQKITSPTGRVAKAVKQLNDLQGKASTKSIRTKQASLKNELSLLGLTTAKTVVSGVTGIVAMPKSVKSLVKNPSQIMAIPSSISRSGVEFGRMIKISPTEAIGVIAGNYLFMKISGATFKATGKLSTKIKNIIRPVLNKADRTKFLVDGRTIRLAGGTSSTAESLAKQAGRAGGKATPVTALSDDIFNLIRRKKFVRKPIPGENLLSKETKALLKKFDSGKISKTETIKLDRLIKIETKGAGSLLERTTFADPAGRVRTSRLGIGGQKDAKLVDILSGDYTFRANKPRVLVFDDIAVEAFPKALKSVAKKFKAGKTLTTKEADLLLQFQLKKSGKFKPIGALSRESEIVLAPGEVIQKVKTAGYINVAGKRVAVVKVRVVKPTGELKKLLTKFDNKKISAKEINKLTKMLEKKTGFKTAISRSGGSRPLARFPGIIGARFGSRTTSKTRRATTRTVTRPKNRKATTIKTVQRRATSKKRKSKRRAVARKPATTRTVVRKSTAKKTGKSSTAKELKLKLEKQSVSKKKATAKKKQGYTTSSRVNSKTKKINKLPITRARAFDILAYNLDRTKSYRGRAVKSIKNVKPETLKRQLKSVPKNYFVKNRKKFVLRKLKKGKQTYEMIERKKYRTDNKREVKRKPVKKRK